MKGRGSGSGATFDTDIANVFMISDGRVIREQILLDRAKAIEAAGVEE